MNEATRGQGEAGVNEERARIQARIAELQGYADNLTNQEYNSEDGTWMQHSGDDEDVTAEDEVEGYYREIELLREQLKNFSIVLI